MIRHGSTCHWNNAIILIYCNFPHIISKITSSHVWSSMKPNYFETFFLQDCFFCSIIVNKSSYLSKITSEIAKLPKPITHSDISRGHSSLGILSKVYLKSEWRPSWILLIHRPWAIPVLASIANLFYICAKLCSFGRICPRISLTAPTKWRKNKSKLVKFELILSRNVEASVP